MKILYVTTIGRTMNFFQSFIKELANDGHSIDIVTNESNSQVPDYYRESGCRIFHADFSRSTLSSGNIRAYRQIKKLVADGGYDVVHCHTPVASAVTRLACGKFRKKTGLKVFYTAHGFHFYKGAPIKNWLVYYPLEWFCSFKTDTIVTINKEDYERAKKRLHAKSVEHTPGVGIDLDRFQNITVDRAKKRAELGIPEDAFMLISVGELNANKNHEVVIRALAQLKRPDIHYLIAGRGGLDAYLKQLAVDLGIGAHVHLPGYRTDTTELFAVADVNVFPSKREGLGLAAIEGMAEGLPLVCADNRGTREYASGYDRDDFHGVCTSVEMYAEAIKRLADDRRLYEEMSSIGPSVAERFSVENVNKILHDSVYGF